MNLQHYHEANPGVFVPLQVRQVLHISRIRFLEAAEVDLLFMYRDLFDGENSEEPVPNGQTGLFRRDSSRYTDNNEWMPVNGNAGRVVRSGTLRFGGIVTHNFTEARLPDFEAEHWYIRRTIRRRGIAGIFTLVHYIYEQM